MPSNPSPVNQYRGAWCQGGWGGGGGATGGLHTTSRLLESLLSTTPLPCRFPSYKRNPLDPRFLPKGLTPYPSREQTTAYVTNSAGIMLAQCSASLTSARFTRACHSWLIWSPVVWSMIPTGHNNRKGHGDLSRSRCPLPTGHSAPVPTRTIEQRWKQ